MSTLSAEQLLKFRLMAEGVRVHPGAEAAWLELYGGPLTLAEYATTSGVALALPGEIYVNAPLADRRRLGVAELRCEQETFFIGWDGGELPVGVIPVPRYHSDTQVDGLSGSIQPHTSYGVTHTDRCRVSPIAGCAWKCKFCDLPYEFSYRKRDPENLLRAIEASVDDPLTPARHVLISGGTPRRGGPGQSDEQWLDEVYSLLAERSPLPVDVMMPARESFSHPRWLQSVGVNAVSINMEISDPERARALAPAKARLGREHYLRYIEGAVEAFGVGRVQSLIVFGASIEPMESTLKGVSDLVRRGCIPVLSPFRPDPATPLGGRQGATSEEMADAYLRTIEICERLDTGVRPGPRCVPCHHNTVTLPDESGFYIGLDSEITDRCLAC